MPYIGRKRNFLLRRRERGASLVEYVAAILLIATTVVIGVRYLGEETSTSFCKSGGVVKDQFDLTTYEFYKAGKDPNTGNPCCLRCVYGFGCSCA